RCLSPAFPCTPLFRSSVNADRLREVADLLPSLGYVARPWTESDTERTVTLLDYESTSRASYRVEFVPDQRILRHVSPALRAAAADRKSTRLNSSHVKI